MFLLIEIIKNTFYEWNTLLTATEDKNYVQEAAVYKKMATHAAEDVAVYSRGPMSFLFTKTVEQNFVAHAMAYSACKSKLVT